MKIMMLLSGLFMSLFVVTACTNESFESRPEAIAVSFKDGAYTVVEGDVLRIPVRLERAPKAGPRDYTVALTVKAGGGEAVEGVDFTIAEKQIAFAAGQTDGEVVVRTISNPSFLDISFTLEATPAGNAAGALCKVTITNSDAPSFAKTEYEVEEETGVFSIPVTLPFVYSEDMVLTLGVIPSQGTVEGTHFTITKEVTIPTGSKTGNVEMNIMHGEVWNDPSFKIVVQKVNGTALGREVAATVKMTEQTAFRKLLGEWAVTVNDPDNCKQTTDAVISTVVWGQEVKAVMKSFWNNQDCYFNMLFDQETLKLKMVLNKRVQDDNWNFGGKNMDVGLRLFVDGEYDLTDIEMDSYDQQAGVITMPKDKHIGGGGCSGNMTGTPVVWGFFFKNGNLTKK